MQLPIEPHLTARADFKGLGEKKRVEVGMEGGLICMHLNWGMSRELGGGGGGAGGGHRENGQIMHLYVCR